MLSPVSEGLLPGPLPLGNDELDIAFWDFDSIETTFNEILQR